MPIWYFKCQKLYALFSWGKFRWTEMICVKNWHFATLYIFFFFNISYILNSFHSYYVCVSTCGQLKSTKVRQVFLLMPPDRLRTDNAPGSAIVTGPGEAKSSESKDDKMRARMQVVDQFYKFDPHYQQRWKVDNSHLALAWAHPLRQDRHCSWQAQEPWEKSVATHSTRYFHSRLDRRRFSRMGSGKPTSPCWCKATMSLCSPLVRQ